MGGGGNRRSERGHKPHSADLLGDTSDFPNKLPKFVDHTIDDVFELYHDDTLYGHDSLLRKITVGDGSKDASNVLELSL